MSFDTFAFEVLGRPAPQGSKRVVPTAAGPRLVESSKAVGPYRETVAREALAAATQLPADLRQRLLAGPVRVVLHFWLARPTGHLRTGRHHPQLRPSAPTRPAVKPDVDKLARAALDGLVAGRAIRDDAQVVALSAIKRYAAHDAPERTVIEITPLPATVADGEARALAA